MIIVYLLPQICYCPKNVMMHWSLETIAWYLHPPLVYIRNRSRGPGTVVSGEQTSTRTHPLTHDSSTPLECFTGVHHNHCPPV